MPTKKIWPSWLERMRKLGANYEPSKRERRETDCYRRRDNRR